LAGLGGQETAAWYGVRRGWHMSEEMRPSSDRRAPEASDRRKPEEELWERRHVRATYWVERRLRDEVRRKAGTRGMSNSQFVIEALQRAVDEAP
jgi:hypothetical protein